MIRESKGSRYLVSAIVALALIAVLISCGGGGVVGGGGTGYQGGNAVGTVNGFGSIIVDGVAFDTAGAPVVKESAPGVETLAEVKLGHRVSIDYGDANIAAKVHVDSALTGVIASVGSGGRLTILGQAVDVVVDPSIGPLTQFGGGYSGPSDLSVGDEVEVHGPIVVQSALSYHIQATRIDKLAAAPAYLRVTGLVSGLVDSAGAVEFQLAGLTVLAGSAPVLPTSMTLQNGQPVTVLTLPDGSSSTSTRRAEQIRIKTFSSGGLDDLVSGYVSHLDGSTGTFLLGGLSVQYAAADLSPQGMAVANGQYVQVRGRVDAGARFTASSVVIRTTTSNDSELRGNVSGYDTASHSFAVRGTFVDASAASLDGCPSSGLTNGLFVEVHGMLNSVGVVARTVECEIESPTSTVEREGIANSVDVAASTFTLTSENGSNTPVKWSDATFFGKVTPQTLAGRTVQVEGSIVSGVLVANHIDVDD